MVNVTPVEGLSYYMDDKLQKNLDEKVTKALHQQDEDYVLVVDGYEGTGKSVMAMQVGKYVDPSLNLDRICFTPDEFRKAVVKATKGQCVIFDEAYRGFGASSALSEVNRILKSQMIEMRQKNLFVIIVLPTFYILEKYVAIWRTKCLIHVFKSKGRKGYWRLFNKRKKQMLYLNPIGKRYFTYGHVRTGFKGRFYNIYVVNEKEYRDKKADSFKKGYKITRNEKYMLQRDRLLYGMYNKNGLTLSELADFCKESGVHLKKTQLSLITGKFKGQV